MLTIRVLILLTLCGWWGSWNRNITNIQQKNNTMTFFFVHCWPDWKRGMLVSFKFYPLFDFRTDLFCWLSRYFLGKTLPCFRWCSLSVGNSVNKTLWTPSLISEAWQKMNSYIVHSNKRLIFRYVGIWPFFFTFTACSDGCFFSSLWKSKSKICWLISDKD